MSSSQIIKIVPLILIVGILFTENTLKGTTSNFKLSFW